MSALTKKERDGLEDVFLSIQSNETKYQKIKKISSSLTKVNIPQNLLKLLKWVRYGAKETNISHFLAYLSKKKKNLSK